MRLASQTRSEHTFWTTGVFQLNLLCINTFFFSLFVIWFQPVVSKFIYAEHELPKFYEVIGPEQKEKTLITLRLFTDIFVFVIFNIRAETIQMTDRKFNPSYLSLTK